jgi:hypothetical protein
VKCSARQPVSWMVGRSRGGSETGFLSKIGRQDVEIIAETRFLGWLARPQKPGFFTKSGVKMPKLSQKPGFLDNEDSTSNFSIKSLRVLISASDIDIENR